MLELVRRADGGLTAAEVVEATGLHASTVRAHLDQLTESGLLTRQRSGDGSPGRPAWRYRAVPQTAGSSGSDRVGGADGAEHADRPYRELAAALVGHLARDADDPHAAGVRAGRDWGRALAAPLNRSGPRTAPLDGLVKVLDQLGFSPRLAKGRGLGAAVVQLRSCPFLDLAMTNPDVVCGVHQGVIGGALGALGASAADVELQPFAAPGACLVRVRTGPATPTRPRRGQSL
jgi:predicted ArsR family transcriptional regulator